MPAGDMGITDLISTDLKQHLMLIILPIGEELMTQMFRNAIFMALFCLVGCQQEADTEECFTDDDCPAGQECVITHDHEGDDHDHGGACEVIDTAEE